jgi:Fe-S oxidoreductase
VAGAPGPVPRGDKPEPADMYRAQEEPARLLMAKDELTWMTRATTPDREVDVFLLLGCGARSLPHIQQDSVAVLKALGVQFVAGAGQQFCCGNPYRPDRIDAADRLAASSMDRMTAWGARTIVHWCTACQLTFSAWSAGASEVLTGGRSVPMKPRNAPQDAVENIHVHTFIERRLRELGDRVPWKKTVKRRVLVEGHPEISSVHDVAMSSGGRMLSLVPGVEVLGYVQPPKTFVRAGSNCTNTLAELDVHDVQKIRAELAAQARERGADTISCQHHNCHRTWSRFASAGLRVQQCVSIVAEALGVVSEDRHQRFALVGDTETIVSNTEPLWRSWDLERPEAANIAEQVFDPKYATTPTCACGGDISKCTETAVTPIESIGTYVR